MAAELKTCLTDQFAAALAMLRGCVAKCPDELWGAPVGVRAERKRWSGKGVRNLFSIPSV